MSFIKAAISAKCLLHQFAMKYLIILLPFRLQFLFHLSNKGQVLDRRSLIFPFSHHLLTATRVNKAAY